jgi:hypothetical protein
VLLSAATAYGPWPTGTVAVTVLLVSSITDTELEPEFVTNTVCVTGSAATPTGWVPTGIVAVTVSLASLITDTVPSL